MLHERFFRQNAPPLRLVKDSGCRGRSLAWRGLQAGTAFLATRQNLCQVSTYRPTWVFSVLRRNDDLSFLLPFPASLYPIRFFEGKRRDHIRLASRRDVFVSGQLYQRSVPVSSISMLMIADEYRSFVYYSYRSITSKFELKLYWFSGPLFCTHQTLVEAQV